MLYSSERNYGCRFLEINIYGYRAIVLENERIRLTILLDKGTEIIEFNLKETDTDFIWRAPQGLSCLKKLQYARKDAQILTDGYTGGWFEAFPNVGGECTYNGAIIPQYGEVSYLPWEYSVEKDEVEEVIIKCFLRTTKTPYYIEKRFSIKTLVAALLIEECIINLCNVDLFFQWGYHPNFGSNFIDESCMIDMPPGQVNVHFSAPGSRFLEGAIGEWPYVMDKEGNKVNLRKVMPRHSGINEVIEVNGLCEGRTTVLNTGKGLGIKMAWDINMFKHNVIWQVCNGDTGYPRYGNTHVLGFVPRNDMIWGLDRSAELGKCPVIRAGEKKTVWFALEVFMLK